MNEIIVEAKAENIDKVMDFINERLGGCPMKVRNKIEIAVDKRHGLCGIPARGR